MPPPPYSGKGLDLFYSKRNGIKKAFTLAETLITLAIIGVIAALTVPTLLAKYQKHTYVVGLKKAYSQLSNAVKMIPLNEGCPAGDFECAGFMKADPEDWGHEDNGAFPERMAILAKSFKTNSINDRNAPACKKLLWGNSSNNFTTSDGMCYSSSYGYYEDGNNLLIYVDVNGTKGPNELGRDQFAFYIAGENKNGIPLGTLMPVGSKQYEDYDCNNCWYPPANKHYYTDPSAYSTGRVLEEDAMNY